jgi:hypothetical protein
MKHPVHVATTDSVHVLSNLSLILTSDAISFTAAYNPGWTFGLPFRGFLITHIQAHGRTPLDE